MVLAASLLHIQSVSKSEGFSSAWAPSRSPSLCESLMSLAAFPAWVRGHLYKVSPVPPLHSTLIFSYAC